MPLIKNQYPILEHDIEKTAVIIPNRKNKYQLPIKCVYGFLGDYVKEFAEEHNLSIIAEFRSMMKMNPIYKIVKDDNEIVLCSAPLGASASTAVLELLISRGVKEIYCFSQKNSTATMWRTLVATSVIPA